ncbi:hypothetical protein BDV59DRAFT_205326 [Aspergillus ambiguus]|uniref:uncharacterized protein n=1 Tax=Aspergillus ambiguus TaxID=176160 RepID=UPI003CCCD91D
MKPLSLLNFQDGTTLEDKFAEEVSVQIGKKEADAAFNAFSQITNAEVNAFSQITNAEDVGNIARKFKRHP